MQNCVRPGYGGEVAHHLAQRVQLPVDHLRHHLAHVLQQRVVLDARVVEVDLPVDVFVLAAAHLAVQVVVELRLEVFGLSVRRQVRLVEEHVHRGLRAQVVQQRVEPAEVLRGVLDALDLRIYDVDDRAALLEALFLGLLEAVCFVASGEVVDSVLEEAGEVDLGDLELVGGVEVLRVVRVLLVEDHFDDARLAHLFLAQEADVAFYFHLLYVFYCGYFLYNLCHSNILLVFLKLIRIITLFPSIFLQNLF